MAIVKCGIILNELKGCGETMRSEINRIIDELLAGDPKSSPKLPKPSLRENKKDYSVMLSKLRKRTDPEGKRK